MTVYVDDMEAPFRRMIMSHMWADTVDELHEFAARLGLRRDWFQCPPAASWEHYDVSKSVKRQALAWGAVLTDRYGPLEHVARLTILDPFAHPLEIARACNRLIMVANAREK